MPQIDLNSKLTDSLSPAGYDLLNFNPAAAYTKLVVTGGGNPEALPLLKSTEPQTLLTKPITSKADADAMLSGLWLWHDWLDPSHRISQDLHSSTGSFWHAIMHRREGDFSNAKYWYARVGNHPVLASMAPFASDVINQQPADKSFLKLIRDGWDPDVFVDLAEALHNKPSDPRHGAVVALQRIEWRLLFDHCTRAASA